MLVALVLRVLWLGAKPPHFDEGVNGWWVDRMTEQGYYHYDPTNFHGPLHFYLLFLAQTLFGRHIWALRLPLALIGTGAVAQMLSFRRYFAPASCRLAALAMALSPAMVFYARYAIHETELLAFLLLLTWGLLGVAHTGKFRCLALAALGATGCILTKETWIIHFLALALAWPALRTLERWRRRPAPDLQATNAQLAWLAAVCLGLLVFFYSGGLLDWSALPGLFTAFSAWVQTGTDAHGGHNKEWYYWFQLIGRYTAEDLKPLRHPAALLAKAYELPLAFGLLSSGWVILSRRTRALRYVALAGVAAFTGYSIVRYKTPWCLIAMAWPFLFTFGEAIRVLAGRVHPWLAGTLAAVLLGFSARAAVLLNFYHASDEEEPYAYVQTLPAIERILEPLQWLVGSDPARLGLTGYVLFPAGDGHPLPWLLAEYPHIEILGEDGAKPVMDADFLLVDNAFVSDMEERLHERYFREEVVIRGNSGESALLYFRASVFAPHFPGREPEFRAVAAEMKPAAAVLYASAISVGLAIMLAFGCGGLARWSAVFALAAGGLAGAWNLRGVRGLRPQPPGPWEWAAVVAFALFALRSFLWVVFFHGDEIRVLNRNNLGDLSLHVTYLRELVNGVPFWPANPIVAGAKLTYPLGLDLLHSLLLLAGLDLWRGFVWMGLAGALLSGVALWQWGRGWALAGFLANGGLAGFAILQTGAWEDYQAQLGWKSIPLALFVTQRGLLFALPAGLLLLHSWRARWFGREPEKALPLHVETVLYAAMPIFHLHTFLALSFVLGAWFLMEPPLRRAILTRGALAFLPATLFTLLVTDFFRGPSLLGLHPGWMTDDPDYLEWYTAHLGVAPRGFVSLAFWPINFGFLPVLLGWALWHGRADRWVRAAAAPALALFTICCFVRFAVWPWDNTKLMIWSYLLVLPLLGPHLLDRWPAWARVGTCALLFGSGFVSLLGGLGSEGYAIGSRTELAGVAEAVGKLPPAARFLANPSYNHPLLLLGRPLALGYPGHVWSHGYELTARQAIVESILNGDPDWRENARALGCGYLYWGPQEQAAFPNSDQPWRDTARVIAAGDWGTLYDLEAAPVPPHDAAPP